MVARAKPKTKKQEIASRLERAIIRAEPPDHPSLVLFFLLMPIRLRGVSPPHDEPTSPKKQGKTTNHCNEHYTTHVMFAVFRRVVQGFRGIGGAPPTSLFGYQI